MKVRFADRRPGRHRTAALLAIDATGVRLDAVVNARLSHLGFLFACRGATTYHQGMVRAIVTCVALGLMSGSAHAECAEPMWVGTAGPSGLPPQGSVFVYLEGDGLELGAPGATRTRISDTVTRVDYDLREGSDLVLLEKYRGKIFRQLQLPIDPNYRAPSTPPRVRDYWHQTYAWTCSSSDSIRIEIDQYVAAFRARWTFDGRTTEWILPPEDQTLELGKINCGGTTLPPEQMRLGGHLQLIAIRFDGSEVVVEGLPSYLSSANMRDQPTMVAVDKVDEPTPKSLPTTWWDRALWPLIAAIGAVGIGWLWRTRERWWAPS